MLRRIGGRQNPSIKRAARLQKKSYRRERGLFVTEGLDLLLSAEEAGRTPVEVLVREDLVDVLPGRLLKLADEGGLEIGVCDAETLSLAGSLGGASDVVAVFPLPSWSLADVPLAESVTVLLCGVGDPGNVGTVVRGAVAFGAAAVMCTPGTADPYGSKAVRAGMGAQFLVPVVPEVRPEDLEARIAAEERRGNPVPRLVAADPRGGVDSRELGRLNGGSVLVLGSERGGLPTFSREVTRVAVRQVRFDSLNVAMAATIMLYELAAEPSGKGVEGLLA